MSGIPYLDQLRTEVVSAAARRTSWSRRQRMLMIPIMAAVGLLVVGGVAISNVRWPFPDDLPPGTEPIQRGETAYVATGTLDRESWTLTARMTDQGLCVGVQYGPGWGEGCGFPPVDDEPVQLQVESLEDATIAYGHVRSDVKTVTIHLENGASLSEHTLVEDGYDVRFYVQTFKDAGGVDRVVGYNSRGETVGVAK